MAGRVNFHRIIPIIVIGAVTIVTASIIFVSTQMPSNSTQFISSHAKEPEPSPSPEIWNNYKSEHLQIAFKFPLKLEVIEETSRKLVLGNDGAEITFSTLESVPIHKLRLCSFAKKEACIYDTYVDQKDPFLALEVDDKKGKSFYFKDENGHDWHIVSLSTYEEFQIMIPVKYDDYFDDFLASFDFWDNNEAK